MLNKFFILLRRYFRGFFIYLSLALYRTETDILKSESLVGDGKNRTVRKTTRSKMLSKFYKGVRDEKYVETFYEILKKADVFIKKSDKNKFAVTADKHGMLLAKPCKVSGRIPEEHFGFFDDKHKNRRKNLESVLLEEMKQRRTDDDNYEIIEIYNNAPTIDGFGGLFKNIDDINSDFIGDDLSKKIKTGKLFKFPIKINRVGDDDKILNKIETLAEFMHVKLIGFEHRQLEFFVPLKFRTSELSDDNNVIKEITTIGDVIVTNQYGETKGFGNVEYLKRIKFNNMYDVFKFSAIEIINLN